MFVVARTDCCGSRRYTASSEAPCLTQGQHKKSRFLRLCCWLYALLPYLCCNSVFTRCLTYQVLCSAVRAIPCCRAVSEPHQGETSSEAGLDLLPLLRLLCRFLLCHFLHDWHLIWRSFQVRRLSNGTILCDLRNRARCRRRAECGFEYCAERLLDRVMGGRRRYSRQVSSSLLVPRGLGCPLTPPGSFLALLFIIGGCGIHSDRLLFAANCATSRDRRLQRRDDRLAGSLLGKFVGSHHAVFGEHAGFEGKSLPLASLVAILLRMWHRTGCAGFYEGKSSSFLPSFSLPSAYRLAISILPRMWYRCGCRRISTSNGRALSHAAARIVSDGHFRECPRAAR